MHLPMRFDMVAQPGNNLDRGLLRDVHLGAFPFLTKEGRARRLGGVDGSITE
jgi:hypothetical protein